MSTTCTASIPYITAFPSSSRIHGTSPVIFLQQVAQSSANICLYAVFELDDRSPPRGTIHTRPAWFPFLRSPGSEVIVRRLSPSQDYDDIIVADLEPASLRPQRRNPTQSPNCSLEACFVTEVELAVTSIHN
ncbi:hypothetical protein E4U40_006554 [Claviceps sp. LM458 group G5]|nr:hypothetical protein E4U40_006554 [Claviceps sp. LM458 group G5]